MERGSRDWRLRGVLFGILAALLATASVVQATPPAVQTVTPPLQRRHHHSGHAQTGTSNPQQTPGANTPPTVPGAVFGPVTRPRAGGGCGFSLSAQAASVPVGDCTVLEIGDSLGNDLGWGLQREVAKGSGLHLVQMDTSASGLVNTTYYDWPAHLADYLHEYHPQLVLVSLGGDDEQGMWVNDSAVQFPTAAWQSAYVDRVRSLVSEATASGAYVLWVGMPVMQPPYFNRGMELLNSIYQKVVISEPNTTFVSTWSLFANPQGVFQSTAVVNGKSASLRESDGIHYSYTGENVLATFVIHEMAQIYHVQIAPLHPAVITGWR